METRQDGVQPADQKLYSGVMRLNALVFGLVSGLLCGMILFLATVWLVIKGGDPVGPHLALLNQYFWGYSVTVPGSFVGFVYGFLVGMVTGLAMGWIYNKLVNIKTGTRNL